jgi:hypothetical protein
VAPFARTVGRDGRSQNSPAKAKPQVGVSFAACALLAHRLPQPLDRSLWNEPDAGRAYKEKLSRAADFGRQAGRPSRDQEEHYDFDGAARESRLFTTGRCLLTAAMSCSVGP